MRRLLYIPIIHDEPDMGVAGATLGRKGAALAGHRRWATHEETMGRFWASMAAYLRLIDPHQLKIYQDGLAADGSLGRRIVEEGAKRGGRNYQLLLEMLGQGAELRKTEDPAMLLEERQHILDSLREGSAGKRAPDPERDQEQGDRLMKQRDLFIAETINATLKEGELGVLFIGAQHQVSPHLAGDISVHLVKDPGKIQAYWRGLVLGQDVREVKALARHLASPVDANYANGAPATRDSAPR